MTSETGICNRALAYLRQERIASAFPPDANSEAAALCNTFYEDTRDAVLQAYPWNDVMTYASLAIDATAPLFGFSSAFTLPGDCLRLLAINPLGLQPSAEPYKRFRRKIFTDAGAPLEIMYTARVTTTASFSPLLVDAIAARLAADLGALFPSSRADADSLWKRYLARLHEARKIDAQEGTPNRIESNEWFDARQTGTALTQFR